MATKKEKFKGFIKRKSRLDKEIEQYEELISQSPNEARHQLKLGDLYLEKGEKRKGVEQLVKAADCFNESGFYLKSIAIFKKILRMETGSIHIYLKLGELYQRNGLLGDALVQYKKVVNISRKSGKLNKAIEILRKLIDVDTSNMELRAKFAEFLYGEGLKEEALEELIKVADFMNDREDIDGLNMIRENLSKIYDELQSSYRLEGKDITEKPFYSSFLSLFQEQTKPMIEEEVDFQRPTKSEDQEAEAESTHPEPSANEDESLQLLEEAQIYSDQGLYSESVELYNKILDSDPLNELARAQLMLLKERIKGSVSAKEVSNVFSKYQILKERGEFDIGSLAQKISAVEIDNENEKADLKIHYELGMAYRELGLFDEALEEFQIAVKDPEWEFYCYNVIAGCYREKGAYDDAIKNYQKALKRDNLPKSAFLDIYYELGKTFENNGMGKEALVVFKKINKMDINYKDVQEKMKKMTS